MTSLGTNNEQQSHKQTKFQENAKIWINDKNFSLNYSNDGKVTIDAVYNIQRDYPASKWSDREKQYTLQRITEEWQKAWLFSILLGLKSVYVKTDEPAGYQKVTFYYVDKLATALKEQIKIQKKSLLNRTFDLTKIPKEAQEQLLIPFKKSAFFKDYNSFEKSLYDIKTKIKILQNLSFLPYRNKVKVLGFKTFQIWGQTIKVDNLFFVIGDIDLINLFLKKKINDFASPVLHTLQNANDFDLTYINVGKEEIDVSSLVNSKVQEASELSLEQIRILKKLQPLGLSKLKDQVQARIDTKLDSYKTKIQSILNNFIKTKIQKIEIKKTTYQIDFLFQDTNLNKKGSQLSQDAKTQLSALVKAKITSQELIDGLNDSLLSIFQKNWDAGKVSNYLVWLPIFDIQEVKLNQNKTFPVAAFATAIQTMLTAEKLDFTKLEGEAKKQLLNLLNVQGKLKEEKTFQDDVWKQIKNHQKWKIIEESARELSLQLVKTLLFRIQDSGIKKASQFSFFKDYDFSFLQDNQDWKTISFQEILHGMTTKINGTNVEFYSHLFPNKVVFQVPMKKLDTVFSNITITDTIKTLKDLINVQQEENLKFKQKKSNISDNNLVIGLSVGAGILTFSSLGGFLYWFFKIKK